MTQEEYFQDIDIKYELMSVFLIGCEKDILDITYNFDDVNLHLQIIALADNYIPFDELKSKVIARLPSYSISFDVITLTKEQYNENEYWKPKHYTWLTYMLLSKANII